jgi:protein-tyrosine phosphatase
MIDYDQILPDLWLGSYPRNRKDIARLRKRLGVSAVLSLQSDADFTRLRIDWTDMLTAYRQQQIQIERVPIIDFDTLDLRAKLASGANALNDMMQAGHSTYVHCTLGVERSASVTVAYLSWHRGMALDEAWTLVKKQRECAPSFEALWLASQERGKRAGGE